MTSHKPESPKPVTTGAKLRWFLLGVIVVGLLILAWVFVRPWFWPLNDGSLGASVLKTDYLGRLQVTVEVPEKETAQVYVDSYLVGQAPLSRDVFLQEGKYTVLAVGLSPQPQAPFPGDAQAVVIKPGTTTTVTLKIPRGTPLAPKPKSDRWKGFNKNRVEYNARLERLQHDSLVTQITSIYQSLLRQPPSQGRCYVAKVPLWGPGPENIRVVDLQLAPPQVHSLGNWISQRYELEAMVSDMEEMQASLQTLYKAALERRDQKAFAEVQYDLSLLNNTLYQARQVKTTLNSTIDNLNRLLQEAEENARLSSP